MEQAARGLGLPVTRGGTYLVMEGPQFSTRAESELYRAWGCSVIGMTNMPEAKLAREAELCYATVAMVTDFRLLAPRPRRGDGGRHRPHHDRERGQRAQPGARRGARARRAPRGPCPAGCDRALEFAIVTSPEQRNPELMAKLDAVAGRVLA